MIYPFLLYSRRVLHTPLFPYLQGDPYLLDLSPAGPLLDGIDVRDQRSFQKLIEREMAPDHSWGVAGYLERRDTLLRECSQMVRERRFHHLGLDIVVALGTELHAPLAAVVEQSGYEPGDGNYGGHVLLRHEGSGFETFFSLYGHLGVDSLPARGKRLQPGQVFAATGDFEENGNWFHHIHLQVITAAGIDAGFAFKGYCAADDLRRMEALCPSPIPLFKR
jgi:hypothetical protein